MNKILLTILEINLIINRTMKIKLIESNPMELNPPIDSMINNFIKENKYVLI
jgi:hypothetical protein